MTNNFRTLFHNALFNNPYSENSTYIAQFNNSTIWEDLIEYLHDEQFKYSSEDTTFHNLVYQLTMNSNSNSIARILNDNIDLNEEKYDSNNIEDFWNESVQSIMNYWKNAFTIGWLSSDITINDNSLQFKIEDIKKADAANSFKGSYSTEQGVFENPYVWPYLNVDKDTYLDVRNSDKVVSVLQNSRNLQFTHTQDTSEKLISEHSKKYLRLIMPKYTRRVEIEDLNRDFWVIGQTITRISSFLFDSNSPIGQLYKKLLNEIVQLWENIIYLWGEYAILRNNAYPIRICYLPLPNNMLQPYRKYDNFTYNDGSSAADRVKFLADKYPNNSLVIVPYSRTGNYDENFFSTYYVRRIIFYNKKKNQWFSRYLCSSGEEVYSGTEVNSFEEKFIIDDHKSKLSTLSHNGKNYKAVRVIPHISAEYSGDDIKITNFQLDFIDVAEGKKEWALKPTSSTMSNWIDKETGTTTEYGYSKKTDNSAHAYFVNVHIYIDRDDETSYNKHCYLGDCVSIEVD